MTAIFVMRLKHGKLRSDPSSFRPISLLSGLGKLKEETILVHLQEEIDSLGIVPDEQHGFCSAYSTAH